MCILNTSIVLQLPLEKEAAMKDKKQLVSMLRRIADKDPKSTKKIVSVLRILYESELGEA